MKNKEFNYEEKQIVALLIQNNPKLLKKKENIQFCKQLLQDKKNWKISNHEQKSLDIIIFPEMAFTGYNFQNYDHIVQMACYSDKGEDFQFAREVAKKYKAYVVFGYVQKVSIKKLSDSNQMKTKQIKVTTNQEANEEEKWNLYNSAAVLDRQGKLILNTRKSHLYFCDELWAQQGEGFKSVEIINSKGKSIKCAVGICMDINQKNFSSGDYQLGNFIIKQECQCLIFISNWTDNSPQTNEKKQLIRMLNYWLERLSPLLSQGSRQRLFLISDRVGKQYNYYEDKQSWFFGCSGGVGLNPVRLYEVLDKKQQGCILIIGKI